MRTSAIADGAALPGSCTGTVRPGGSVAVGTVAVSVRRVAGPLGRCAPAGDQERDWTVPAMAASRGDARPPTRTSGSAAAGASPRARLVTVGSVLWACLPLVSVGMFAGVPVVHAAARLRRIRLWLLAVAYASVTAFAWVTVPTAEVRDATAVENLAAGAVLVLMIGGTIHAFLLRRHVFGRSEPVDPAVADVLAARRRREEARSMAESDPALARELGVGRPDLDREYDDGGLIDVNHVPPGVLVTRLDFSAAQAAQAVQQRVSLGGFTGVQELGMYCDLSPGFMHSVSDRIVFLP